MAELDSTQRFSDRADAYAASRPTYPDIIAPLLTSELELPPGGTVVDLGSGTGLSCVPFLRAGFAVIGVEPNDAMRAAGEKFLAGQGNFRSVAGRSEATTLQDQSVDLVIAAQAAHWFDIPKTRAEMLRILRPPANLAIILNDRDAEGSPFAIAYEKLLAEFGNNYGTSRHRQAIAEIVAEFFSGSKVREAKMTNPIQHDFPTLLARVHSVSYMPQPDAPNHTAMVAQLRKLFTATKRNGKVTMEYVTRVFFGTLAK